MYMILRYVYDSIHVCIYTYIYFICSMYKHKIIYMCIKYILLFLHVFIGVFSFYFIFIISKCGDEILLRLRMLVTSQPVLLQ